MARRDTVLGSFERRDSIPVKRFAAGGYLPLDLPGVGTATVKKLLKERVVEVTQRPDKTYWLILPRQRS